MGLGNRKGEVIKNGYKKRTLTVKLVMPRPNVLSPVIINDGTAGRRQVWNDTRYG